MQLKQLIKEISLITGKTEKEVVNALKRLSKRAEVPFEDTVKIYHSIIKRVES